MAELATAVEIKLSDVNQFRDAARLDTTKAPAWMTSDDYVPGEAVRNFRVALVTMPFGPCWTGSIQIALLKAILTRAGFPVEDFYPNVDLAARIGVDFYTSVSKHYTTYQLTGEWLFAVAAFGDEANRTDYFEAVPDEAHRLDMETGKDIAFMNDLRERAMPEFVDAYFDSVDWGSYSAVGFTSTFQQHIPSLALARRIKEKFPHVAIVFGGSNMDGEMGLEHVRAFPYIDYGVIGEGDVVFPELLKRLAEGRSTDDMLGVISREGDGVRYLGPSARFRELDALPTADFSTYYRTVASLGIDDQISSCDLPRDIPVEASRGCWWGAKQHCTFCNLADDAMTYRSKSTDKLHGELVELAEKTGVKLFWATDSIMDWRMLSPLLIRLAEEERGFNFSFFNLKANMTREQIRILRLGGLVSMQAGVESLSTRVLKLMRKGCTKLQNLTTLKWTRYYGVRCGWNLLHGFPDEHVDDYEDQLETLRKITHFHPPDHRVRVVHLQFSPLFYDDDLYPKKWRRPAACYDCIYPSHVNVDKVACYFDAELFDTLPENIHEETREFVDNWKGLWSSGVDLPTLTYRRSDSDIVIEDKRFGASRFRTFTLLGPDADIYEAFGSAPRTPAQARAALVSDCPGMQPDEEYIRDLCNDYCDAGLMIGEAGKYLSLALPADPEF